MNRKTTAVLLITAAVLTNAAFTVLGSVFDYPDVLKEPVADVLAAFREHQGQVSFWFAVMAVSAALFAPIAIGVGRLSTAGPCGSPSPSASRPRSCRSSACPAGRCSSPASPPTPRAPTPRPSRRPTTRSRPRTASWATWSARPSATCSPRPGPCSSSWPCTAAGRAVVHRARRRVGRAHPVGGAVAARPAAGRHRQLRRLRAVERLAGRLRCPPPASSAPQRHRLAGRRAHRGSGLSAMTTTTTTTTPNRTSARTRAARLAALDRRVPRLPDGRCRRPGRSSGASTARPPPPSAAWPPVPCSAPARPWPARTDCPGCAGWSRPHSGWAWASSSVPSPSTSAPPWAGSS